MAEGLSYCFGLRTAVVTALVDDGVGRNIENQLREAGIEKTATVSSFGERHSAWHWYAGFHEVYNSGEKGMDLAEDVASVARDWLERRDTDTLAG